MIKQTNARKVVAILAVTALGGLTGWTGPAGAHPGPKPFGISGSSQAVIVEDPIRINMRRGTEVTTTRLTVQPGGHTAWHYHPGPHVVAVTVGTVTILETDCTERGTFTAGHGFFDPGSSRPRNVHTLFNLPENGVAEVVITDFRVPGAELTVAVDHQPPDCF